MCTVTVLAVLAMERKNAEPGMDRSGEAAGENCRTIVSDPEEWWATDVAGDHVRASWLEITVGPVWMPAAATAEIDQGPGRTVGGTAAAGEANHGLRTIV